MQDSKLSDVPKINLKEITSIKYKINTWADCITCNWYTYVDFCNGNSTSNDISDIEVIAVCDMNLHKINSYLTDSYNESINNLIIPYNKFKNYKFNISVFDNDDYNESEFINNFNCIVTQNKFNSNNNIIRMTPGVVEVDDDLNFCDSNKYRSVEKAMIYDKNHVVIIGSNIIDEYHCDNLLEKCSSCAKKTWEYFTLMYGHLLNDELLDNNAEESVKE